MPSSFKLHDLPLTAPDREPQPQTKTWVLTTEAFNKLLAVLDPDPGRAAARYEGLRQKLAKYFAQENCATPDELVDQTIDCVARKISEGEMIRAIDSYCRAIAWRILHEHWREQARLRPLNDNEDLIDGFQRNEEDQLLHCTKRCLQKLPAKSRVLFIAYYEGEKRERIEHRTQLARQLNVKMNMLRKRIFKIREPFEACVDECLKQRLAA